MWTDILVLAGSLGLVWLLSWLGERWEILSRRRARAREQRRIRDGLAKGQVVNAHRGVGKTTTLLEYIRATHSGKVTVVVPTEEHARALQRSNPGPRPDLLFVGDARAGQWLRGNVVPVYADEFGQLRETTQRALLTHPYFKGGVMSVDDRTNDRKWVA